MRDFSEFDEYLTEEGRHFLQKWGHRLIGLYDGSIRPTHPNEDRFVEVFRSGQEPKGLSESFWFNLTTINWLLGKCAALERKIEHEEAIKSGLVKRVNSQEREIEKRIKPLEEENRRLKDDLSSCWVKIDEYEKQLGIAKPIERDRSGDRCPVCKGTGGMGNCSRCDGSGYL